VIGADDGQLVVVTTTAAVDELLEGVTETLRLGVVIGQTNAGTRHREVDVVERKHV